MGKVGNFITRHMILIVAISLAFALAGTITAAVASTAAASAQKSTLLLTQSQGDQIAALASLTKNETDLSNELAQENNNQLKRDANLLCGGFVPISKIDPVKAHVTTALGLNLIKWAHDSALTLDCPGHLP